MAIDLLLKYHRLAEHIVKHSCSVSKGEKVWIEAIDVPEIFLSILIDALFEEGALPFLNLKKEKLSRQIAINASKEYFILQADNELSSLKNMDVFIGIKNILNSFELSDIPKINLESFRKNYLEPVHFNYRNNHLKWVYLRFPSEAMAQKAKMSTESFYEYYFESCLYDYSKFQHEINNLIQLLENTKTIRITGNNTDLSFEVDNMPVFASIGKINLPDGEIFTAPVKKSVNGKILFNVDSTYHGQEFRNVAIEVSNGKIVNARCDGNDNALKSILETDAGSVYFGEFALGLNPVIKHPINEIVFDEKMITSIHLAIGNAYKMSDNGNRSAIHWDLILDQSEKSGGGQLYFDNILVKENGKFLHPKLNKLNT